MLTEHIELRKVAIVREIAEVGNFLIPLAILMYKEAALSDFKRSYLLRIDSSSSVVKYYTKRSSFQLKV